VEVPQRLDHGTTAGQPVVDGVDEHVDMPESVADADNYSIVYPLSRR
jgi:hypothetical protein